MNIVNFQWAHLQIIAPEIFLVFLAAVVMGLDLALPESRRRQLGIVTAIGLFVAMVMALIFSRPEVTDGGLILGGMIRNDFATFIFRMIFLFSGAVTALISVDVEGIGRKGEYYAMLIGAVLGMTFMAAAADLIMLYLALETTSIGLYAMAGFLRDSDQSTEAGLKYFLFGAMTSTVMLYGFSLLFGYTGQTNLYGIADAIGRVPPLVLVASSVMIIVGVGFKVALVPFHFWTPDVYEGAPTPVTAFLSVASKSAGFAVLIRLFIVALHSAATSSLGVGWLPMLTAMAAVTMTVGNFLALPQHNIKRLLAYSSIAHAGYAMMGIVAFSQEGIAATVFYLTAYVLTNLAAFTVVVLFARTVGSDEIADYAGLSRRAPGLALAMLVAFLSLGGMPPLVGFVSKFFVFAAAMRSGLVWLTVLGVLNSIVGLYYYLIVLKMVYVKPAPEGASAIPVSRPYAFALSLLCASVLVVGIVVAPWLTWATAAAQALF